MKIMAFNFICFNDQCGYNSTVVLTIFRSVLKRS